MVFLFDCLLSVGAPFTVSKNVVSELSVMSHNYIFEQCHIFCLLVLQLLRPISACHSMASDAVSVRQ